MFKPITFEIESSYRPLLVEIRDWVHSRPKCDFISFKDDGKFQPILVNNQIFEMTAGYPYAFIRSIPARFSDRIMELIPATAKLEFGLNESQLRLFCNLSSLDWHTDAPYRHRALNIAVSDAIGDTTTRYLVRSTPEDLGSECSFQYEYQKAYIVDIEAPHCVISDFHSPGPRTLISFSIS